MEIEKSVLEYRNSGRIMKRHGFKVKKNNDGNIEIVRGEKPKVASKIVLAKIIGALAIALFIISIFGLTSKMKFIL